MTTNWQNVKLIDVCDLIAGYAFKSGDFGNYMDKVIKITNIEPPFVNMKDLQGVDLSMYNKDKLQKYIAKKGDYVFAMTGATIGKLGKICEEEAYINQRVLMFKPKEQIDKNFLFYILSQKRFYQYVLNHVDSDSAQANISANSVGGYDFNLPPLEVQRKIAGVLGALDDKIELNNRINQNLESQAQAIFIEQIQKNTTIGKIGDYCSVKSGFAFKSSWWKDSGTKVIKIKNIEVSGLNLNDCSFVSDDKIALAKDFTVKGGDLLIAMTGATIGKFAMVPHVDEILLVNQRVGKFFLGDNPLEKLPFIYCTLKQQEVVSEIINRGQGSAQPNISGNDIMSISCIYPNNSVIEKFNNICKPYFEKIITNQYENTKLSAIRDALLPKLMSGEIDVENVPVSAIIPNE